MKTGFSLSWKVLAAVLILFLAQSNSAKAAELPELKQVGEVITCNFEDGSIATCFNAEVGGEKNFLVLLDRKMRPNIVLRTNGKGKIIDLIWERPRDRKI